MRRRRRRKKPFAFIIYNRIGYLLQFATVLLLVFVSSKKSSYNSFIWCASKFITNHIKIVCSNTNCVCVCTCALAHMGLLILFNVHFISLLHSFSFVIAQPDRLIAIRVAIASRLQQKAPSKNYKEKMNWNEMRKLWNHFRLERIELIWFCVFGKSFNQAKAGNSRRRRKKIINGEELETKLNERLWSLDWLAFSWWEIVSVSFGLCVCAYDRHIIFNLKVHRTWLFFVEKTTK